MDMVTILEMNQLALAQGKSYHKRRFCFDELVADSGKHFLSLIGPRGSGKTILLKQLLVYKSNVVYVSLDAVEVDDLFALIETLVTTYKYTTVLLDEIHHFRLFRRDIKKVYDHLQVKIYFTSSVALSLYESTFDLSRRVKTMNLFSFSFREYLFFKTGVLLSSLLLKDIIEKNWTEDHLRYGYMFASYLKGGLQPFSLDEPDILPLLSNVLEKILFKDIPLISSLSGEELGIIRKMVEFIGKSQIDGISYSAISQNLKITKYKAAQYVTFLEKAFILQVVWPKGTNVLKEPKIMMYLPYRLLFQPIDGAIGGLREDFFVEMMRIKGVTTYYLKSTQGAKTPDYLVIEDSQEIVVEIGGKNKGREQFKGIDIKKALILSDGDDLSGIKRPLFLAGY